MSIQLTIALVVIGLMAAAAMGYGLYKMGRYFDWD